MTIHGRGGPVVLPGGRIGIYTGVPDPVVTRPEDFAPIDHILTNAESYEGRAYRNVAGNTECVEFLLPAVFQRVVDELAVEAGGELDDFKYYLERHIGLDAGEHGPMANRLLESLFKDDEARWQVAGRAAVEALEARRDLWDGICDAIRRERTPGIEPANCE